MAHLTRLSRVSSLSCDLWTVKHNNKLRLLAPCLHEHRHVRNSSLWSRDSGLPCPHPTIVSLLMDAVWHGGTDAWTDGRGWWEGGERVKEGGALMVATTSGALERGHWEVLEWQKHQQVMEAHDEALRSMVENFVWRMRLCIQMACSPARHVPPTPWPPLRGIPRYRDTAAKVVSLQRVS